MEYSDSVWDNCNNDESNKLESIHTEAARIITGATKLCSIDRLFKDLDWETLQNRRRKHRLLLFYKMFHRLTPDFCLNYYLLLYIKITPIVFVMQMTYKHYTLEQIFSSALFFQLR